MSMYMSTRGKFSVIINPLFEVGYYTGKDKGFLFYAPSRLIPMGDEVLMFSPTYCYGRGRSNICA